MKPDFSAVEPIKTEWLLNNNAAFQRWVENNFKDAFQKSTDSNETCPLFDYQRFVQNFFATPYSPYRGILLYHGLGTGKTMTSIASAEALSDNKDIIVMLPASLSSNYVNEIIRCTPQRWKFYARNSKKYASIEKKAQKMGLDEDIITENDGIWWSSEKGKNFDDLEEEQQEQIKQQIEAVVKKRYTFIHYNGLDKEKLGALVPDKKNIFENKVVVIDEVHNFMSAVKNNSKVRQLVFELLMHAENVKIIALSGTPIINDPFELSFIGNLLKGYIRRFTISLPDKSSAKQRDKLYPFFEAHRSIDYFDATVNMSKITVVFTPCGFRRTGKESNFVRYENTDESYRDMLEKLFRDLKSNFGIQAKLEKDEKIPLLPLKNKEFNNMFVSRDRGVLKNTHMLSRRLQGMVSYYESFDNRQFPDVHELERVLVPMSESMFKKYYDVRQEEKRYELESRSNDQDQDDDDAAGQSNARIYKTFSRLVSLFYFPPRIKRVFPSDISKSTEYLDDNTYENNKKDVMDKLRKHSHKYLTDEALREYGPKYAEIMERSRECRGTILIYSQFREVEGIGIMQEVLRQNGHYPLYVQKNKKTQEWELRVDKHQWAEDKTKWDKPFFIVFTQDKERNKVLLDIYNNMWDNLSDTIREQLLEVQTYRKTKKKSTQNLYGDVVKYLLITQSGAEGISLRNVRQIHILEPYWNPVRIKQIIGRASRVQSHIDLPKDKRTVTPFIYIMKLDESQVVEFDANKTSDQMIMDIADRKNRFIQQVQEIMQQVAVDCPFHQHAHVQRCFQIPPQFGFGKFAYVLDDVKHDIQDDELMRRTNTTSSGPLVAPTKTVRSLTNGRTGKMYYFVVETMEVIDPELFRKHQMIRVLGKLVEIDGQLQPRFF